MKNKPQNFTLKTVKRMKNGGLQGKISFTKEENGITNTEEWDFKNTEDPHPELIDKLDSLKSHLANCYDMDATVILSNSKGLQAKATESFDHVKTFIAGVYTETLKKIDINGISIGGEKGEGNEDRRNIVILGTKLMLNGSKAPLNSPSIKLNLDVFSTESEIQERVNEIEEEVVAYLYEGKKAQQTLFNDSFDSALQVAV